jgi:hypothetical protein
MAATFQTIPTANPAESAFVLTVDDNLITPLTLPAAGTTYAQWTLGQRERTKDTEWDDYIFVDTVDAAPGRRAFVFGKSHGESTINTPFETIWDTEFHRWPAVVSHQLKVLLISNVASQSDGHLTNRYLIKSAVEGNSLVKIEHFQNAVSWPQSAFRHPVPITDDLKLPELSDDSVGLNKIVVNDCLHGEIKLYERVANSFAEVNLNGSGLGHTIPATNFTDWAPYVLRDTQKQSNGLWVREKVTVFPPINAKRKLL